MHTFYSRRIYQVATAALLGLVAFRSSVDADSDMLVRRLQEYYVITQPEVSYLHLDQAAYAAGETLWFKAYVLDARAHQPDSLSRVLYVDVVTPERKVIFRRTLALEQGLAAGDIVLPDTLRTGVYTLRAYTSWMRNSAEGLFFTRRVPIWQAAAPAGGGPAPSALRQSVLAIRAAKALKAAAKPDVQFFPEGGDYVAGLPTTVGVKAITASGRALALEGVIQDEKKQEVGRFKTPALGMTSFSFTPLADQRYRALVTLPDGSAATYDLPAVQQTGWLLNVREIGDSYRVFVRHQGSRAAPEPLRLLAHVRGELVYVGTGSIAPGETYVAVIPKAKAPAGLLHITLFDGQTVARAERLVFVPETRGLQVRLRPDKSAYGPRQLVTLDVDVSTADGAPAPAELSLAVTSVAGLPAEAGDATTVRAHLLLTSELKGYVENPAYYFQPRTPEIQRALDDLLLTQGWSRFTWQQVLVPGSIAASYLFPLERTLTLSGELVRGQNKPVPGGQLTLLEGADRHVVLSEADGEGRFLFTGFTGADTVVALLQARTSKGSSNVLLRLNELWPVPTAAQWKPIAPLSPVVVESAPVVAYGQRSRRQQVLERQYRPDSTSGIVLRNITITGQKPVSNKQFSLHGNNASAVIQAKDFPNIASYQNIFELLQGRVAGVLVSQRGIGYSVTIRGIGSMQGSSEPLFLLDGIQLTDKDALLSVRPTDVDRIEVLKGANAAIYGSQGGNGVIAVFTKRGAGDLADVPAAGVAVRRLPGFYRSREFYAPRYETTRQSAPPDPRATTLYWQPRIAVPASGKTRITFYTADQPGAFRTAVEGVSLAGQPATAQAELTVVGQP